MIIQIDLTAKIPDDFLTQAHTSSVIGTETLIFCKIHFQIKSFIIRSGVEDTRLEAKAKDTKKKSEAKAKDSLSEDRTDPLEAKDRNARGQGRRPRTQPQVFSKKKGGFQKFFSGDLQFIGVPRIFDWEKLKLQIT